MIDIDLQLNPDESPPPPPGEGNKAVPVTTPDFCWLVEDGDGQIPAVKEHDSVWRGANLGETNEVFPRRPFDAKTGRVSPISKHIVNLQGTTWLDWQFDVLGPKNFGLKGTAGDGYEDTDDDSIPPFLPNGLINPDKPRKQMCADSGGGKVNVTREIVQSGSKFCELETMDFFNFPKKVDGVWLYDGKPMTWDTHPHLFTSRVNTKKVKTENQTWISSGGTHAVSDGGLIGNKMKEWWPNPSKVPVTQPRSMLRYYPTLPVELQVFGKSVIVDGKLEDQYGGTVIQATRYKFAGSKVFVFDERTGNWYLAEEMLIRASLLTGWYATALDYRCYTVFPGSQSPWMGRLGYGVPDPGIYRKDMGLVFYFKEIGKAISNSFR